MKGFLYAHLNLVIFLFSFIKIPFLIAQDQTIVFNGDSEPIPELNSAFDESALLLSQNPYLLIYSRTHNRAKSSLSFMPTDIWLSEEGSNKRLDLDSESIHSAVGFLNQNQSF